MRFYTAEARSLSRPSSCYCPHNALHSALHAAPSSAFAAIFHGMHSMLWADACVPAPYFS